MEYDREINWKSIRQYWGSVCSQYAVDKFTNDNNVVDWDNLPDKIIKMQTKRQRNDIHNQARQNIYNLHSSTNHVSENIEELSLMLATSIYRTVIPKGSFEKTPVLGPVIVAQIHQDISAQIQTI
ncbi:hypothetical protein EDC94DRAFT_650051 [Helicostylum pulchrum]|nr:hypothetical protein EDC94DRAFT_650051 [Helicostylum pulchrum]